MFGDVQTAMLLKQAAEVDIIVSTVLIPGQRAPTLINKEIIDVMMAGSVTVNVAVEAGGNIETTVCGDVHVSTGGVTCIGYTNLPGRMGAQASTLYSNNFSAFLLSMGPFTGVCLPGDVMRSC